MAFGSVNVGAPKHDCEAPLKDNQLKENLADTDSFPLVDSADGSRTKRVLWSKICEAIKNHFDTVYTSKSKIGKPNGVASLDPDGKVPAEQLPEMDVSQTLAQAELKNTPADDDGVLVTDSAAGNATKRVLWSRIEAALKGYFDPLYAAKSHTHSKAQITDFPASLPANGGNAATVGGLSSDQLIAQAVAKGCRIATGSYVGTGAWGESSPNKLTFSFTPKVVFVVQYFNSASGVYGPIYSSQKASNAVMVADTLTESFQSGNGFYELGYINDEARYSYGKKSKDGKTFYWYFSYDKDRSSSQLNSKGDVYYWVAIG